jgi:hypothetical protein
MASPWLPYRWGWEAGTIGRRLVLSELLRFGRLVLVSYLVAMATWTLLGPTFAHRDAQAARAAPLARGPANAERAGGVSVSIDGLVGTIRTGGTVQDVLRSLGLAWGLGERLSAPADAVVLTGQRITVDSGLPVTLLDAGRPVSTRFAGGTVGELLTASGVVLGPLDRTDREAGAWLGPGDVVRITRVGDYEVTLREPSPFAVRYVQDPNLDRGRQILVTPGLPGERANTYRVRVVDGTEVGRALLASVELAAPSEEVRRVGTRAPSVPAEIEAIIRDAAARHGADPEQLLRVAWCESRYDPSAYNASGASGLFQFMPRTWAANSVRAGYAGASPFDPVAAANVAAWMFARGSASLWTCR